MQKKNIKNAAFLKNYIDGSGLVDYDQLKNNLWLKEQIKRIESFNLNNISKEEKLAFWLNAYNILVLQGVCIELSKNSSWNGNTSLLKRFKFFYIRKFTVARKKISLYNLENKILRKEFKDPRIHFAINCASRSCPLLPNKLFEAETLNSYLDELTRNFVNDENQINYDEENNILYVNRIFEWYSKDFLRDGGVLEFILKYLDNSFDQKKVNFIKIVYFDYDWSLNSQLFNKHLFVPHTLTDT